MLELMKDQIARKGSDNTDSENVLGLGDENKNRELASYFSWCNQRSHR